MAEDFEAELADENHPEDMLDPDGYDEVDHVDESDDMPGAAYADSDEDHPEMLDEPSANRDGDPVDSMKKKKTKPAEKNIKLLI